MIEIKYDCNNFDNFEIVIHSESSVADSVNKIGVKDISANPSQSMLNRACKELNDHVYALTDISSLTRSLAPLFFPTFPLHVKATMEAVEGALIATAAFKETISKITEKTEEANTVRMHMEQIASTLSGLTLGSGGVAMVLTAVKSFDNRSIQTSIRTLILLTNWIFLIKNILLSGISFNNICQLREKEPDNHKTQSLHTLLGIFAAVGLFLNIVTIFCPEETDSSWYNFTGALSGLGWFLVDCPKAADKTTDGLAFLMGCFQKERFSKEHAVSTTSDASLDDGISLTGLSNQSGPQRLPTQSIDQLIEAEALFGNSIPTATI